METKTYHLAAVVITLIASVNCWAEFQVNTHTTNKQENPAIAMDSAGNFIVVWNSYLQDGSSNGIFGQRFDRNHNPIGREFQINSTSTGNQKEPSVAMNADGSFVVAWQGTGANDEDEEDIFARLYNPNGIPVYNEFHINTNTADKQLCPAVAMSNDGGFVIVWESVNVPQDDKKSICGQLYNKDGLRVGAEFVVNNVSYDGRYPNVAMDTEGNFIVVWMEDRSSNSILGRLYNPHGSAKTESFVVSSTKFSSVTEPSVAVGVQGHFIVTWDGHPELAKEDDIHVRIFNADGTAFSEQFIVNTTTAGPQQNPRIAVNNHAQFIIVWDSKIDPDINEREIFAQRYNNFGIPIGDEFQVNAFIEGDQKQPGVAMKNGRDFITVWQSDGQDGSGYGVFGQMDQIVGSADFNGDGIVNFLDFCIFNNEWFRMGKSLTTDLTEDNKINEQDLAEFCRQWLSDY
ncbi:MAG: hypothetical protein JW837_01630 [Sedimentisphaerales bacterium]|nr:hypothetical protein [Sedimentisphaerales bacterium]